MTAWKKYVLRRGKDKRENLELQIAFSLLSPTSILKNWFESYFQQFTWVSDQKLVIDVRYQKTL